jgi:carbon-monoxide dehydrogenase large subunit
MSSSGTADSARSMRRNAYVGSPVERLEDLKFLRGKGQYVDDIHMEGVLHAVMLRSSIAHGRIRSLDVSAARAMPGVHSVVTAADMPEKMPIIPLRLMPQPELEPFGQPVIAADKVRYVGEVIAMVLAESQAEAEDALAGIEVEIDPLPALPDRRTALAAPSLIFEDRDSNHVITYTVTKGASDEVAAAFANADYVRREALSTHRHVAFTMEARGLLSKWNPETERLTFMGAAKVPFQNRRVLAGMMGLPESSIDMIENDVGGGYGARGEFFSEDFLVAFAARRTCRPVKWTEDRREHLLTMGHARQMDCEIELACKSDGTILGLRGEIWVDVGAYYRTNGTISPRNVAHFMAGAYRVPCIELRSHAILTNKAPIGTYRGPGRFEADFFRERMFDIVARDLGIDQVEFRRRNLVTASEMPYPLGSITPVERDEALDSGDNVEILDQCLREFGWAEKEKLRGRYVDGVYHGLAIGSFIEGGAAGPRENAKMALGPDGIVTVYVGATAVGQGVLTVLLQIAADALELPMDRLKLLHGSTIHVAEGFGSYHSRSTVMSGSAILLAAEKLRGHIRDAAAARLGYAPDAIEIGADGATARGGETVPLGDLAGDVPVVEEVYHNHTHTYAYGSVAVHVTVDPRTGSVRIVDLAAVEDVGRVINPLTMKGQVVGGLVQGLGGAMLEEIVYDGDAQILTGSLQDYLVPLATDFPNIRVTVLGKYPSPVNPLGAKGGGEGGTVPAGGLIANAVASALSSLGVEPRALPMSPSNVWQLIQDAKARKEAAE